MSQPEDIFLKQLEYPVECAKNILNNSGQDLKNVNCDLIDMKEEFTYQELENKVEGKYEDNIYGFANERNISEDNNREEDFIIKTDEVKRKNYTTEKTYFGAGEKYELFIYNFDTIISSKNDNSFILSARIKDDFKWDDIIHVKKEEKSIPGIYHQHI